MRQNTRDTPFAHIRRAPNRQAAPWARALLIALVSAHALVQPASALKASSSHRDLVSRGPQTTYRIQLGRNPRQKPMTFESVIKLLPYLEHLGVRYLHLSPVQEAPSEHRYNGTTLGKTIAKALGGRKKLEKLHREAKARGISIVDDIVPNHSFMGHANLWLQDVFAHGKASPKARKYHIHWEEHGGKLVLPFLGDNLKDLIRNNQIKVAFQMPEQTKRESDAAQNPHFALQVYDHRYQLDPQTLGQMLVKHIPRDGLQEIRKVLRKLEHLPDRNKGPRTKRSARATRLLTELAALCKKDVSSKAAIDKALGKINKTQKLQKELLEAQAFKLVRWDRSIAGWKRGRVNYERFFAYNELIKHNLADPKVRGEVIANIVALKPRAVRIDHIDGLRNPKVFLRALRKALGPHVAIIVEKIWTPGEPRIAFMPGDTGYGAAADLLRLQVSKRGLSVLEKRHNELRQGESTFHDEVKRAKRELLLASAGRKLESHGAWPEFKPELERLVNLLERLRDESSSGNDKEWSDLTRDDIRNALVATVVEMPSGVYRNYVTYAERLKPSRHTKYVLGSTQAEGALGRACKTRGVKQEAVALIEQLLLPRKENAKLFPQKLWKEFIGLFQPFTSALQAKGEEDTAMYRLALGPIVQDVGSPLLEHMVPDNPIVAYHQANKKRQEQHVASKKRYGMAGQSGQATHDRKMSADLAGMIAFLSEIDGAWIRNVKKWHNRFNAGVGIDQPTEELVYRLLWGAMKAETTKKERNALKERVQNAVNDKAVREAKLQTNWFRKNEDYEAAVKSFIDKVFEDRNFRRELSALQRTHQRKAYWTGLARVMLTYMQPGVPETYNGEEVWRMLFVDPDNRLPVNFQRLSKLSNELDRDLAADRLKTVQELAKTPEHPKAKLLLVKTLNQLRNEDFGLDTAAYKAVYGKGKTQSGQAAKDHVVAFIREHGGKAALTVAPRLIEDLTRSPDQPPIGKATWGKATIRVPKDWVGKTLEDRITGKKRKIEDQNLLIADILEEFPGAVLVLAD